MKSEEYMVKQLINYGAVVWLSLDSIKPFPARTFPYLFCAVAGLNLYQAIGIGMRTGGRYGKGSLESFCMSMAFGHDWWLPLKRRMKEEELGNDDFERRDTQCLRKERAL